MRRVAQAIFHGLAPSPRLRTLASRLGLRPDGSVARRFVAGESAADAIAVARELSASGLRHTLAHLGERATSVAAAHGAARAYLSVLDEIGEAGIERHVTLALTHFGLLVDRATCVDALRRILDRARGRFIVRLAMEDAQYTQQTIDVFDTLWGQAYRTVGVTVQAVLPRSVQDARRLSAAGASVRLVQGGYPESRRVTYRRPAQSRAAFLEIMRRLLLEGSSPAIATHDERLIDETRAFASRQGVPPERFEFEMYYGARPDLQAELAGSGYRVRVSVPFGREWFPYLMRRVGDRPTDVMLLLRGWRAPGRASQA
jgi:proline dehydrogenase